MRARQAVFMIALVMLPLAGLSGEGITTPPDAASSGVRVLSVRSDSVLENNHSRYGAGNLIDGDPATCWSEGVRGSGIGQRIIVTFNRTVRLRRFWIVNGIIRHPYYAMNNRVRTLSVNGKQVTLEDHADGRIQEVRLPGPVVARVITLVIKSVYRGNRWDDTCLSEIFFRQPVKPFSPGSIISRKFSKLVDPALLLTPQGKLYIAGDRRVAGRYFINHAPVILRGSGIRQDFRETRLPGRHTPRQVIIDRQGNLLVCGTRKNAALLYCFGQSGQLLRLINHTFPGRKLLSLRAALGRGGNILIAGMTSDYSAIRQEEVKTLVLMKISGKGERLWTKEIPEEYKMTLLFHGLVPDPYGNAHLLYSREGPRIATVSSVRLSCMKITPTGKVAWNITLDRLQGFFRSGDVCIDKRGILHAAAGHSCLNGPPLEGGKYVYRSCYYRIGATGRVLLRKYLPGNRSCQPALIAAGLDGTIYISGNRQDHSREIFLYTLRADGSIRISLTERTAGAYVAAGIAVDNRNGRVYIIAAQPGFADDRNSLLIRF